MMVVAVTFVGALIIGLPIIAVLGFSAIVPVLVDGSMPIIMIAQAAFSGANQIVLQAIAAFMLAGILMEQCGITDGLLLFAKEAVGRVTGGYAVLTIFLSTFFAALTGAGPACAAAVGTMTIPLMLKGGYDKNFSSAVAGGEGLFNLSLNGVGAFCIESECPKEELIEITLQDDVLKVDGNYAIAWSGGLNFTVERSGKSLIGSAASGEGLVNVYRGTGKVLMMPTARMPDV